MFEKRIDPRHIRDKQAFAAALSALRSASEKTIREIASAAQIPSGTLGGYMTGRHLPAVNQPESLARLLSVLGVTDEAEQREWALALTRVRSSNSPATETGPSPYRGLLSYTRHEVALFYGRDALSSQILNRVARLIDSAGARVLTVVGPSGSGKSSLLAAGVLGPADPEYANARLTPGSRPLENLAAARARLEQAPQARRLLLVDQFEELFTGGQSAAVRSQFIDGLLAAADTSQRVPTVLLIGLRADFYGSAMQEPRLVSALQREQILVGPMSSSELREAIIEPARAADGSVDAELVDELLRDLAPSGNPDGTYDAGSLPLLSHALLSTWQRARHRRLSLADYRGTGGIQSAIQQSAEAVYESLSGPERQAARRIFVRLGTVDDEHAITRRRIDRAELLDSPAAPRDTPAAGQLAADVDAVLDRFIAQRLVTVSADGIEVSHEALLTHWPRLRGWFDEDRAGLRAHRRLTDAAQTWSDVARDGSALLRGAQLEAALAIRDDAVHGRDLNRLERDFLAQSEAALRRELDDELRRNRHRTQLLVLLSVLVIIAAGLSAVATISRSREQAARKVATLERDQARSAEIATEADQLRSTDPSLAMQLALAAYDISPTTAARSSLLDSTATQTSSRLVSAPGGGSIAVSSARQLAVVATGDGHLRVLRLGSPVIAPVCVSNTTVDPTGKAFFAVALSPDATVVAMAGIAGSVTLLSLADPSHPALVAAPVALRYGTIDALAWSPDGRTLVAGMSEDAIARIDVADPRRPVVMAPLALKAAVKSVAISPDGRQMASGTADGQFELWPAPAEASAADVTVANGPSSNFTLSLAFSPDSHTLAVGSKTAPVQLFDVSTPTHPVNVGELTGFASWENALAFSADGTKLAAASSDTKVHVFSVAARQQLTTLPGGSPFTAAVFAEGDATLLTADVAGTTRAWPLESSVLVDSLENVFNLGLSGPAHQLTVGVGSAQNQVLVYDTLDPNRVRLNPTVVTAPVGAAHLDGSSSFSPDGRFIASGSSDGTIYLWQSDRLSAPAARLPVPGGSLTESTALNATDKLLASGGDDSLIRLWDLTTPDAPRLTASLDGGDLVEYVTFNAAGTLLAAAGVDRKVRIWDVSQPDAPVLVNTLVGFSNYVYGVAFSPDGRTLAAASTDGTVRLWDISDPHKAVSLGSPLSGAGDSFAAVAFSPDGSLLAAATNGETVWLWNVTDRSAPQLAAKLRASDSQNNAVLFSADSSQLYAGGNDHVVRVWDTATAAAASRICALAGTSISPVEWSRYVAGVAYRDPCAGKTGPLQH